MNAIQLQSAEGTKFTVWMCAECNRVWPNDQQYAEACCRCPDCGKVEKKVNGRCWPCIKAYNAKRDAENLERAEEVVGYSGPVYVGDEYYSSLEEYTEDRFEGDEFPEFVNCCEILHYTIDAGEIVQNLLENAGVEEGPDLNGIPEFEAACAAFNKANESKEYWYVDEKRKIRVPRVEVSQ